MLIEVEPDDEREGHRYEGVATRVAKLSRTSVRLDLSIDPEGPCLVVPQLRHVHREDQRRQHGNVVESTPSLPIPPK